MAGLESNDDRRRKMAAEVQLVRYIQSMVRVEEDTYRSRELVPNAIFELFAREFPDFTPRHWSGERFPRGNAVYGVSGSAAALFCDWLSQRSSEWRFELPIICRDPSIGSHWRKDPAGFRCCYLPNDWEVLVRKRLAERLASRDHKRRLRTALGRVLASEIDLVLNLGRALAPDLDRTVDLDRARAFELALSLDRAFVIGLAGCGKSRSRGLVLWNKRF